ncbi:Uma2 family endonuclease [Streptomyces fumanus]|uniref:Uma2 family endonuclease n=1 Tax=Streptomyces fumanus TaxID=67302 RepID=UPI0033C37DF7
MSAGVHHPRQRSLDDPAAGTTTEPNASLGRLTGFDVRIDYPGHLNGFASDVVALADGAEKDDKGRWRPRDVEFVAEVIFRGTAGNDYGPKKDTYAAAGVPVYLIIDPYTGEWHLHTLPKDGTYHAAVSFGFGEDVDLSGTAVGLVLRTDGFPRD